LLLLAQKTIHNLIDVLFGFAVLMDAIKATIG
jgi:hypothetical protein